MKKEYSKLLNLEATKAKDLFARVNHPWEVLPQIKEYILDLIPNLGEDYICLSENVYAHKSAKNLAYSIIKV